MQLLRYLWFQHWPETALSMLCMTFGYMINLPMNTPGHIKNCLYYDQQKTTQLHHTCMDKLTMSVNGTKQRQGFEPSPNRQIEWTEGHALMHNTSTFSLQLLIYLWNNMLSSIKNSKHNTCKNSICYLFILNHNIYSIYVFTSNPQNIPDFIYLHIYVHIRLLDKTLLVTQAFTVLQS